MFLSAGGVFRITGGMSFLEKGKKGTFVQIRTRGHIPDTRGRARAAGDAGETERRARGAMRCDADAAARRGALTRRGSRRGFETAGGTPPPTRAAWLRIRPPW